MTKREKAAVRQAIEKFSAEENDWEGGMRILFRLLGKTWPMDEIMKNAVSVPIEDIASDKRKAAK